MTDSRIMLDVVGITL